MKKISLLLAFVIGATLLLSSCFLLKNDELDKITTSMVNSYISGDQAGIKALTHPDYIDKIRNIDMVLSSLKKDGIVIDGTLSNLAATERSYSAYDSEYGGQTEYSVYNATIGDSEYIIKVRTLKNDNGYGIIQFDLGLKK